jgi:hypothetical protein
LISANLNKSIKLFWDIDGTTENTDIFFSDTEMTDIPKKYIKKSYSQKDFKRLYNKFKKYKNKTHVEKKTNNSPNSSIFEYINKVLTNDYRNVLILMIIGISILIFINLLKSIFH